MSNKIMNFFFIQKSLKRLKYLDLSNNEVTKEEGYKEYVIEYFAKSITCLDGYVLVIINYSFYHVKFKSL